MFINIHIIQNFPASNLNRDDTGAPKDTIFGGFRRARISSQCQKRSVRSHEAFRYIVKKHGGDLGIRTKRVFDELVKRLAAKGKDEDESKKAAENIIAALGLKKAKNSDKTEYLLYLGEKEIEGLVSIALDHWNEATNEDGFSKEVKKAIEAIVKERRKKGGYAADIALFGRMVADDKKMNVDAACQVAHAISTHKTALETDYYTAVDDLLPDDESGSDMIGIVEYNGACYYRYADIDYEKLKENLGEMQKDLAPATVIGFVKGMIEAIPTGMQNSFAAQTYPAYVEVTMLDAPISYANAFSKPVRATERTSIEEASIEALQNHAERSLTFLGKTPDYRFVANFYDNGDTVQNLLEKLEAALKG